MKEAIAADALNTKALFVAGCRAMFVAGVSASLRAAIAGSVKAEYIDRIDLAHSAGMVGAALGVAFLGWSVMLFISAIVLEKVGMKALLLFASGGFVVATLIIMFCGQLAHGAGVYTVFYFGIFLNGLAWGGVEGAVNPLVAALYPKDVTGPMNSLHAWWPGLIGGGGLFGAFAPAWGVKWRAILGVVPVLGVISGLMVLPLRFPQTVSASLGVPAKERFLEIFRRPVIFVWLFLMLLTSASELSPGQWVDFALTDVVGMRGVLLLAYVSGIQFVGRHFAGPLYLLKAFLAHRVFSWGSAFTASP